MPDSPSSSDDPAPTPGDSSPLSRRATRWFVIAAVALVVAASVGGALYIIDTAREAQEQAVPADTTAPPDSIPAQ